jgi:hypothetical protein
MARRNAGSVWVASLGERLGPPKQSAMNSRIPKRTILLSKNPPHVMHSPSTVMANSDEWTIRISRGKHVASPPSWHPNCQCFLHHQIIGWSRLCVLVLRWSHEQQAHSDLSWFRPLLRGNIPTSSWMILKMNKCYNGWVECSRNSCGKGGMDLVSLYLNGRCPFIDRPGVP